MIPTRNCPYCSAVQPASASFCGACGHEFRAPRRAEETPPPVPSVERRFQAQGGAATRVLIALLAVLAVAVPLHYLPTSESWDALVLDAAVALVVLACVAMERGALAPALRAHGGPWLLAAAPLAWLMQAFGALWFALLAGWLDLPIDESPMPDLPVWLLWVSVVLVPAVFEEIAFRGIFLRSARLLLRPMPAQLLTAGCFAAIHFQPLSFPFHFALGLALGLLRERSGSLWPPMLLHALNNALAIGLIPGGP